MLTALSILIRLLADNFAAQQTPHLSPGPTEAPICGAVAEELAVFPLKLARQPSANSGGGRGIRPAIHRSRTSQ